MFQTSPSSFVISFLYTRYTRGKLCFLLTAGICSCAFCDTPHVRRVCVGDFLSCLLYAFSVTKVITDVANSALMVLSFAAEIRAGMWRKNGQCMNDQVSRVSNGAVFAGLQCCNGESKRFL